MASVEVSTYEGDNTATTIFNLTIEKNIIKFFEFKKSNRVVGMKIILSSLSDGMNEFHFISTAEDLGIDDAENLALFPENILADVEIQKLADNYFVRVNLNTQAHFQCDRCLEAGVLALDGFFQIYFTHKHKDEVDDDEYRFLSKQADAIDLTDAVFENLMLLLPMKKLCSEQCRGLCPECGANLNVAQCNCQAEKIDPRWEKLRTLTV